MRHYRIQRGAAAVAVIGLVVASCGGSSDDTGQDAVTTEAANDAPVDDEPETPTETDPEPDTGAATDDTSPEAADDEPDPATDEPVAEEASDSDAAAGEGFGALPPATGEPIVLGMVNTEGVAGLDFPEMRTDTELAVAWVNEHGGFGGRPVEIEHCTAAGSPESSQACAQELVGKGVEMVMLGLDLFPGYDTFTAAGVPVVGALPVLPPDYTANALFFTGGNATTMAAMVALAVEEFDAQSVGIVSADNPGANGSEAALIAALDKAGVPYNSVKGGDNETDAGFEGLIRQANDGDPDLMISLYADAGCVGAMRGRVSLGITTPMVSTAICGSAEVLDVVGDDALGWYFVGVGETQDTVSAMELDEIIAPAYGENAEATLGLGALGITQLMSLARVANNLAAGDEEVSGVAIYERMATSTDILDFPNDSPLECGRSEAYPSICSFSFPIGTYGADGAVMTVPGFELKSVIDYLP